MQICSQADPLTRHVTGCGRLLARLALCTLLGLSTAFDRSPDIAPAASRFPLRQLETGETRPFDGQIILDDDLDTLDDWWLLRTAGKGHVSLVPAGDVPGLGARPGEVVLPPDCALVRQVPVSMSARYTLSAFLQGSPSKAGRPCPHLSLAWTHNLKNRDLAEGRFSEAGAATAMAGLLLQATLHPKAEWRVDADSGFAEARTFADVEVADGRTESFLVMLTTLDAPLLIDSVSLSAIPSLRLGYDARSELPTDDATVAIAGLTISGQYRISARVPPGQTLAIPLDVPDGAVDIAVGTCPDPSPSVKPDAPTEWSIVLQPGNHLIAQFSERTCAAGQAPRFTDRLLPWPEGIDGPVTVEFSVTGDAAMVFGQPKVRGPEHPDAPSLLLISIDTLRADHLGFLGYDRPTSPFLDQLASQSTVFTDTVATASYTLPTHASLFTGLFPPHHLAIDSVDRVDAERTPTISRLLSDAGFHTAGFTGGGFMSVGYGFAAGFDRFISIDPVVGLRRVTPETGEFPAGKRFAGRPFSAEGLGDAERWITLQGSRSWMAFIHTFGVHEYDPPREDELLFARPHDLPEDFDAHECLARSDALTSPPGEAERARLVDLYDATIHAVDRCLGDFITRLDAKGLLEHTIVVVTADHGEEFFEHGHFRHHGTLYQDLVHVPLLIRMPDAARGLRIDEPVSQVDILPTLLELLGQPVPEGLDGRSLADFVRGGHPATAPTPLFSHIERVLHARTSLRDGPLKIVHSDTSDVRAEPASVEWEVFDLQHDPDETRNLAGERPAEFDAMRQRLDAVEESLRAGNTRRSPADLSDELRDQLIELGYVEAAR